MSAHHLAMDDKSVIARAKRTEIARKFASAMIAKIPEPLSRHIARVFMPGSAR